HTAARDDACRGCADRRPGSARAEHAAAAASSVAAGLGGDGSARAVSALLQPAARLRPRRGSAGDSSLHRAWQRGGRMSNPLVSIIIAVYNGEEFLADALDSAVAQDYSPCEIVVVDDGSTDRSAEIAKSYPQVRYIH